MIDFTYSAVVIKWVDGDTVDLLVDLGFTVHIKQRFRLEGIDTPERIQEGFLDAKKAAEKFAPPGSYVVVKSIKTEKYGRYLGTIFSAGESVNKFLLDEGFAKPYSEK